MQQSIDAHTHCFEDPAGGAVAAGAEHSTVARVLYEAKAGHRAAPHQIINLPRIQHRLELAKEPAAQERKEVTELVLMNIQ